MQNQYYVYILTNQHNNVLYVGITNNIERRIYQHKNSNYNSFCKRYNIDKLVFIECCGDPESAIRREKQLKKWRREKKIALVESFNPNWTPLIT